MRHFPAFLDLRGRIALVLGAGEVAERKAALLAAAGATLLRAERFDAALLEGAAIAVGADAPEADLHALSAAAQARGIPVNIVDRPGLCSFIMPAIVERDPVTVAISTGGAAPVLARLIRQRIEAVLPPALGALAALAGRFSARVRRLLPEAAARRRFLESALVGPPAELALAGRLAEAEAAFARALAAADPAPRGMVFLVGAGPGRADLLTLRAQRLLGEADVIVHDRLVSEEVLAMARRDAPRIYVGKARANHCLTQEQINALLVRLAREGRRVVRLKGGDPFVFGRGGEELAACRAAGVPCEVVPGVTAALACAAEAGIPLTHRDAARMLTFVTGHTREGRLDLDFAALARPGRTLAVYMGLSTLPDLARGLVAAGLDAATPAALIENGGTGCARRLDGTLLSIAFEAARWARGGPVLLLVGEVVALGAPAEPAARAARQPVPAIA
jgi:uroporphyrin-III C-methyltransferase/precorrin-2 dehydrogenase/sirohydrochlorin ferrochelatase